MGRGCSPPHWRDLGRGCELHFCVELHTKKPGLILLESEHPVFGSDCRR